jgi:predicted glycogen debranching enzyme
MIRYGAEVCQNLGEALQREWLETNGIGGFASSTIAGLNTRRYHGLLTAALHPPSDRKVLLSKLEETLMVNGKRYELSCNQYPGVIHPQGYLLMQEFRLDPFPVFLWRVDDVELRKSVFMIQGENGVVVQYHLRAQGDRARSDCRLELRPLIAFRDFHSTTHANPAIDSSLDEELGLVSIQPYHDLPRLRFAHDASAVLMETGWYMHFQYAREQERGLDSVEDLFHPFTLAFDLKTQANVIVSTEAHTVEETGALRLAETTRRKTGWSTADQYIVARTGGKSVIAGYHWFGDWGRDTMIALPGLTLATGRPEIAREILTAFSLVISDGMLPNRFPDRGEQPEYNTVDATLWYFEAIRAWMEFTGDTAFVKTKLLLALREIIEWHRKGTRYGIHMDSDGLLHAGEPGVQLTWMDAKVGDWVVTPRQGKPVEIQALWYNALRFLEELTGEASYGAMADAAKASFAEQFWNEAAGCLFDVVGNWGKDPAIRPNQLLAFSLPHKILDDRGKAARVLEVVEQELLTPYGLRTLSRRDSQYRGQCAGDQASRDGAYHQGTVWPWLLGPYCDACAFVRGSVDVAQLTAPLEQFRDDRGVGQIPEIFDGDAPHEPRGCIAQAWSVGELLRIKSRYGATQDLHAAS